MWLFARFKLPPVWLLKLYHQNTDWGLRRCPSVPVSRLSSYNNCPRAGPINSENTGNNSQSLDGSWKFDRPGMIWWQQMSTSRLISLYPSSPSLRPPTNLGNCYFELHHQRSLSSSSIDEVSHWPWSWCGTHLKCRTIIRIWVGGSDWFNLNIYCVSEATEFKLFPHRRLPTISNVRTKSLLV